MRIAILGPGRVGRTLAGLLTDAGHAITLHGRGRAPDRLAELVLVTVPDRAIASAAALVPTGPIVLHCSGATSLGALAPHAHRGSLHPMMTFPGPEISIPDLNDVAAAVDGATPDALEAADTLARDLGMVPVRVPGDRRLYHAAAVLAGNYATALLAEAGRVLAAAGVDEATGRAMVAPLALRSLANAVEDPSQALTGPVARGDDDVVAGHLDALAEAGLDDVAALYDMLAGATRRVAAERDPSG